MNVSYRLWVPGLVLLAMPPLSLACSIFVVDANPHPVVGRNYDWESGTGLVIVNPRGIAKEALGTQFPPLKWVSKYGSVTFNQYGRGFPCGGMNERGLVIEVLWLDETEYPAPDERASINALQWIEYQLDHAATIDEVLASDATIRVECLANTRLHYLIVQADGQAASVEFLKGKLVAHRGQTMPAKVLTNSTFAESVAERRSLAESPTPAGSSSLDRFLRADRMAQAYRSLDPSPDAVDYAFTILEAIDQGDYTKWSIVYEPEQRRVHFKTLAAPRIRSVDLSEFDLRPSKPVRVLDLNRPVAGNVRPHLQPYSSGVNRQTVTRAVQETSMLHFLPIEMLERFVTFPDTFRPVEDAGGEARGTAVELRLER